MATKQLIATSGGSLAGSLAYSFSRAATTVDDDGNAVASGAMRFGRAQLVTSAPEFEDLGAVNGGYVLAAAGVDSDGVTPLAFSLDGGNAWRIHVGSWANVVTTGSITRTLTGATQDLLQGFANQDANIAYNPHSGSICHGLIRVVCTRSHWTGSAWEVRGFAALYSQDHGATWTVHLDKDGALPPAVDVGTGRGNLWQVTGYTPADANALTVWFAETDYRISGGGQCMVSRATRSAVGQPFTVEPFVCLAIAQGTHWHSALFFVPSDAAYAGKGQLVVSGGDLEAARTWRFICNSLASYSDPANWTAGQEFFGGGDDPEVSQRGSINQWAGGAAIGYGTATAVVATDVDNCALIKLTVPSDLTTAGRAQYDRLWGHASRFYDGLWVHCPTPERSGPYVARATATLTGAEQRFLYSPDGANWQAIARTNDGGGVTVPLIFGEKIVFINVGGTTARCLPKPSRAASCRPLRVGPGGTNYVQPGNWRLNVFGAISAGTTAAFVDRGTLDINAPVPSSISVLRITTDGVDSGQGSFVNVFPWCGETPNIPAQKMAVRYYLRSRDNLRLALRHSPGSGAAQLANLSLNLRVRQWTPIVANLDATSQSNPFEYVTWIWHHPNPGGAGDKYKQTEEHAPGMVLAGSSTPILGYGVEPNTTGPDEDFKVTLGLSSSPWTVGVALRVPHDSNFGSDFSAGVASVPLFTLYGNASNYVELVADLANNRLTMNACIAGAVSAQQMTGVFWEREDDIRIAVANTGTAVQCSASIAGGPVLTATAAGTLAVQPQDIRLEKADGTTACVDFCGCQLVEGSAYGAASRAALVKSEAMVTLPAVGTQRVGVSVGVGV